MGSGYLYSISYFLIPHTLLEVVAMFEFFTIAVGTRIVASGSGKYTVKTSKTKNIWRQI
jgi:uncharacterized membrane protein SpoIIM required for sporulation